MALSTILAFPAHSGAALDKASQEELELLQSIQSDILAEQWQKAQARLDTLNNKLSKHPDFHYLRAVVFHHELAYGRALEALEQAIVRGPKEARYYILRGQIYGFLGEVSAAKQNYLKAIELAPNQPHGALALARILFQERRPEEAEGILEEALKRMPKEATLHLQLAGIQETLGQPAEARASNVRALELDPKLAAAHGNLGRLYREQSESLATSAEHLQQALRLEPENPQWHYELGLTYRHQQKWEAAQSALEKAAELSPKARVVYYTLAEVYRQQGQEEKARRARQRFSELAGEEEKTKRQRGRLASQFKRAQEREFSGQTQAAIAAYHEMLTLLPEEPEVLFALARLHMNADELTQAEGYIQRALEQRPDSADFHELYAMTLINTRRRAEAIEELRTAIRLRPSEARLHNLLGNQLLKSAEVDAAIAAYQRAADLAPHKPDYHLNLSIAYRQKGEEAAAAREREAFEKLLREQAPRPN